MKSKKHSNKQTFPSGCIVYTKTLPDFILNGDVPCRADLDSFVIYMGEAVDQIINLTNLQFVESDCIDVNTKGTVKALIQQKIDKICEHEESIGKLEEKIQNLNIGQRKIKIDLGCLISQPDPCDKGNIYTIIQVFKVFRNALCNLREQLNACCNGIQGSSGLSGTTGVSGTSGVSGTAGIGADSSGTSGTSGDDAGQVEEGSGLIRALTCIGSAGEIDNVLADGDGIELTTGSFPVEGGDSRGTTQVISGSYTLRVVVSGIAGSILVSSSNGDLQCKNYTGPGDYDFFGFIFNTNPWSVTLDCEACD